MKFTLRWQKIIVLSVLAVLCLIIVGQLLRLYHKTLPVQVLWSYNKLSKGGYPSVAWSPDGKTIAVVDKTRLLMFHAFDGSTPPNILTESETPVGDIAFSPDSSSLAVVEGKSINLYDARTWKATRIIAATDKGFGRLALSPDGTILAAASDKVIQLWDVKTGALLGELRGSIGSIHVLAFSPDGKTLVSADCLMCGPNTNTLSWDVPSRSLEANLQTDGSVNGSIQQAAFALNGSLITVGLGCCHFQASDLQTKQWRSLQLEDIAGIISSDLSDDGNYLLIANSDDGTLTVWDLKQQSVLGRISMSAIFPVVHNFGFGNSAFSPDGKYIATVSDITLVVWKYQ